MYIFLKEGTNVVYQVHFKPELLSEKRKSKGYKVKEIPEEPDIKKNERLVTLYDKEKGEVYYKVEEIEIENDEPEEEN